MSREFWARSFPQKRGSSTISEFNKIADWNNPTDTDSAESTDDIANETAKYFAHLGAKRERTAKTEAAAKKKLDLLGNRTVNESTSDNCGKDISQDEMCKSYF